MLGYTLHNRANLRNCREEFVQFIPKIAVSLQVVVEIKGINFGKQVKDMRNILHGYLVIRLKTFLTICMIELSLTFSMAEEGYTERLWTLVRSLVLEIADDAVGVSEWKKCRSNAYSVKVNTIDVHGVGDFPSDSGSPLSTFSSTPSSFNADSPITPTFVEL